MVNKDMNGFPVKKCSAFQFFKKRVRRWIKSPMVSVDKHPSPSLKYMGPSAVHMTAGEPDFEPSLCQTCLGDHAFQKGVLSQEKESCSWETQSGCEPYLLHMEVPRVIIELELQLKPTPQPQQHWI